ncbi:MAG TPA: cytochrome c [Gemmatimonadales bacterium]|nr:cytochrome c [Gemmatimonadales bacterium]
MTAAPRRLALRIARTRRRAAPIAARIAAGLAAGLVVLLASGCHGWSADLDRALERMREQPRYDPYEHSAFFWNGAVMQTPPEGTIPRGGNVPSAIGAAAPAGPEIANGVDAQGSYLARIPVTVTDTLLARGRSRFDIFCAACHGEDGRGHSAVAQNMIERPPPSLRSAAIAALPPGLVYHVIGAGFGRMPPYAAQLSVVDRWAVVAYVQRLQRSDTTAAPGAPS